MNWTIFYFLYLNNRDDENFDSFSRFLHSFKRSLFIVPRNEKWNKIVVTSDFILDFFLLIVFNIELHASFNEWTISIHTLF